MNLKFRKYDLQLRHTFAIANYSRTMTPVVLTEINHNGIIGYGEAALPQYLGETQDSVCEFLKKVSLDKYDPMNIEEIMQYIDNIAERNTAAKASIDIALHDLKGKLIGKSLHELWGIDAARTPYTSYTIGIDTEEIIRQKVEEASPYSILKIKVNREDWKKNIDFIRTLTNKPLYIDANQSWIDKEEALANINYLKDKNVVLIEQPMQKDNLEDHRWLTERSPLPIIADESIQRLSDMGKLRGVFTGVNIKLMKCTGLNEAYKIIKKAREYGMKVMLGCMTETSCGISAAAQLSPLVDFADLDGNLLIKNDYYEGVKVKNGKITLNDRAGIGITTR